jgi:transcriptional regulator with PAS, ATPase and Fis domain
VESVDAPALELLRAYPFPGNVRELENMLEGISLTLPSGRTSIRADDVRGWLHHRGHATPQPSKAGLPLRLVELELWAITEALKRCQGNKSRAAELLGISRDTLYRKLHELGLAEPGKLSDSRT